MEEKGPNDLRHRDEQDTEEVDSNVFSIIEGKQFAKENPDEIYDGDDPAAKWLRENDPKYKKGNDDMREAA